MPAKLSELAGKVMLEAEDGPVEIRFSWWGNAGRDIGGYFDKLATQVAANDAPDVITMGGAYPAEYANRGVLLDLSKVNASLDLSKMDQGALENGQVKGKQYGVSTGANALAIVVNPAVLRQRECRCPMMAPGAGMTSRRSRRMSRRTARREPKEPQQYSPMTPWTPSPASGVNRCTPRTASWGSARKRCRTTLTSR